MKLPKRVFVCSALRGDIDENTARALSYCAWAMREHGVAAFAPHGFYTAFLDDRVAAEREAGMNAGYAFLRACKEVWAFMVGGRISSGMATEVELAFRRGIPVRWFAVAWTNHATSEETPLKALCVTPLPHLAPDVIPEYSQRLSPEVAAADIRSTFADLEARLKRGESYEDCTKDLDDVLGTALPARNRAAEEAWEGRRGDDE